MIPSRKMRHVQHNLYNFAFELIPVLCSLCASARGAESTLFTSRGGGSHTQFTKQAEACFTYTTYISAKIPLKIGDFLLNSCDF